MDHEDLDKSLSDMQTMRETKTILGNVDRYEIIEKLGEGGFGAVYGANDLESGIYVALKSLPPEVAKDQEEMDDIRSNFQLISKLHHPIIASVLHLHRVSDVDPHSQKRLGIKRNDYLVVMEHAAGCTLFSYIRSKKDKKVELHEALKICKPLAEALDYAHSLKILHRDIKPKNIMVSTDGKLSVKILDFGLAAEIKSSMSRKSADGQSSTSGTPLYMSPEQWAGKRQDGAADQYAIAAIMYELLSGEVPFKSACDSGNLELIRNVVLENEVESIDGLEKKYNDILKKALSKDPKNRYATCIEFIDAFTRSKRSLPNFKTLTIGLLSILILFIASYFFINSDREHKPVEEVSESSLVSEDNLTGMGILDFNVKPIGTTIKVYGMRGLIWQGKSPAKTPVRYGDYDIVMEKRGYAKQERQLEVTSDQQVKYSLIPLRGELRIATIPDAKIVAVDEDGLVINLGRVPSDGVLQYERLIEGNYDLTVSAINYIEAKTNVYISATRILDMKIALEGMPGSLVVLSDEVFDVLHEGKIIGQSNQKIITIPAGEHRLSLSKEGHEIEYLDVNIIPNSEVKIDVSVKFKKSRGFVDLNIPIRGLDFLQRPQRENIINLLIASQPRMRIDSQKWMQLNIEENAPLLNSDGSKGVYDRVELGEHIAELKFDHSFQSSSPRKEFALWSERPIKFDYEIELKKRRIMPVIRPIELLADTIFQLRYLDINGKLRRARVSISDGGQLEIPEDSFILYSLNISKVGYHEQTVDLNIDFLEPVGEKLEKYDIELHPSTKLVIGFPVFEGYSKRDSNLLKYVESLRFRYKVGNNKWSKYYSIKESNFPIQEEYAIGSYDVFCEVVTPQGDTYAKQIYADVGLRDQLTPVKFKLKPSYALINVIGEQIGTIEILQSGIRRACSVNQKVEVKPFQEIIIYIGKKKYTYAGILPGEQKVINLKIEAPKEKTNRPRVH